MEALEELDPVEIREMTREHAQELFEERNTLVSRLRIEMDLLKEKIWPEAKNQIPLQCECCGSTNLDPRVKGGYFCRKCGFRKRPVSSIIGA
jgi:hypothetical protein